MMKPAFPSLLLALGLGLAAVPAPAQNAAPAAGAAPQSSKEKLSYAIGMDIGQTFKSRGLDVDPQFLAAAIKDSLTGAPLQMTDAQKDDALKAFQAEMQAKQRAAMAKAQEGAGENKKKGADFLAANKSKPGVVALPDGLQYKVIKEGTGPMPTASDTVSVNYTGTLIDGKEFDSSKGTPVSFGVTQVIKGWTEALQKMKVGSKWQLFIPSDLAYGENGAPGGAIPPNSTLIFDVELLSIGGK